MRLLAGAELEAAEPRLAGLHRLRTRWMNGVLFYLDRDVPLVHGHTIYIDTPWALTSISQAQFWPRVDLEQLGDGRVEGILSIDVSDWEREGIRFGKQAMFCSKEEVRQEVWAQLEAGLEDAGLDVLEDANVVTWFLDPSIVYPNPTQATNLEPLLINTAGSWDDRPEAVTAIENLFLASDYVRTHTDLATMEGANEAARRAVNGILDATGSRRAQVPGLEAAGAGVVRSRPGSRPAPLRSAPAGHAARARAPCRTDASPLSGERSAGPARGEGGAMTELLQRHLPVLRYDSQGSFMADSPAIMTDRCGPAATRRTCCGARTGRCWPRRPPAAAAPARAGVPRLAALRGRRPVGRSDYLDASGATTCSRRARCTAPSSPTGSTAARCPPTTGAGGCSTGSSTSTTTRRSSASGCTRATGRWFRSLGAGGEPRAMAFAQHGHGQRCGWGLVEKRGSGRSSTSRADRRPRSRPPGSTTRRWCPTTPTARGRRCRRDARGDRATTAGLGRLAGALGLDQGPQLAESNSPRGPAHQEKWDDPETFHEECDEIDPRRERPESAAAGAAEARDQRTPRGRPGGDRLPLPRARRATGPRAADRDARLARRRRFRRPPTRTRSTVRGARSSTRCRSRSGRYEVRVSAADERGNMSEQAVAELGR